MARLGLLRSIGFVALLMVCACVESGGGSTAPASSPITVLVEELEAARSAAAGRLLEAPGIKTLSRSYGEDQQLRRIAWVDYRKNGDYLYLSYFIDQAVDEPSEMLAVVKAGDTELHARVAADGEQPWSLPSPTGFEPFISREPGWLPVGLDLHEFANTSILDDVPYDEAEAVRQSLDDGTEMWTLMISRRISGEDVDTVLTFEIAPDGRLDYTFETETGITADPRIEYELVPVEDPEPIQIPNIGEPLDLDSLDVPENLPTKP